MYNNGQVAQSDIKPNGVTDMATLLKAHLNLILQNLPPSWRLVHLGANSHNEWSCQIAKQVAENGWVVAASARHPTPHEAMIDAIERAKQQNIEWTSYQPHVYRVASVKPLDLEEL